MAATDSERWVALKTTGRRREHGPKRATNMVQDWHPRRQRNQGVSWCNLHPPAEAAIRRLIRKVGRVSETDYTEDTAQSTQPVLNGAVMQRPRVAAFADYLLARAQATPTKERALQVSVNQVEAILAASEGGSDDDIWDADRGGTVGLRDIAGSVIRIHAIEISEATDPAYEADLGVFALIHATMLYDPERNYAQGSDLIINTGVGRVITKLRAFEARDKFPMDAMVTAIKSQSGFVLRLDRAPAYPVVTEPIQ